MDIKEIQNLIKFVAKSGVNEVKIESKDFKLTIKNKSEYLVSQATQPIITHTPVQQLPVVNESVTQATTSQKQATDSTNDEDKYITIKAPIIGTFYRKPSPDKPPYVKVGDVIKEKDVVCIIEAMKLFNEIESEVSGKIVKVLVEDGTPVEFDQPLFLVEPI